MTPIDIIKKNRYIKCLFSYGFLALCFLLNEYQENEEYEECQIILEAIREVNSGMQMDLPTIYDDNSVEYFLNNFKHLIRMKGCDGSTILNNIPYYATCVKKEVEI